MVCVRWVGVGEMGGVSGVGEMGGVSGPPAGGPLKDVYSQGTLLHYIRAVCGGHGIAAGLLSSWVHDITRCRAAAMLLPCHMPAPHPPCMQVDYSLEAPHIYGLAGMATRAMFQPPGAGASSSAQVHARRAGRRPMRKGMRGAVSGARLMAPHSAVSDVSDVLDMS